MFQPPHLPIGQSSYNPSSKPTPHPDNPLEKYALFLMECYTLHKAPSTKWPYLDAQKYINLAVINNEYANREELNKFREQTIHGCVDDILEWKAPITMENILKPNYIYRNGEQKRFPVTQLLIEGAPGIGKSTFAWEVCQKWGEKELFLDFSLVVLLKFRDKRVHEAKTISELFYHPHPQLQSEIANQIIFTRGDGLLLILEGFDEAPISKRRMDSIFVRLFTGQELPKATVILTTRPSASSELRQLCYSDSSRRVEVVGFGKKEVDECIRCAFSRKQAIVSFREYLNLYPHIHSMMYVPLNCMIVTHIYQTCQSTGEVVPKTMTQLYSSLMRSQLLRYLKDREEYMITSICRFKDLPQPVYNQFHGICKLAYTGIISAETELIFQDLPNDFDPLGLMQACPELYVDSGASLSYNFLHLTIQEYLAAYYISQQSKDEQVAFMKKHIANNKLEVVLRFLAGFSLGQHMWNVVKGFASKDLPMGSLLKEYGETKYVKLQILHWVFESQDPSSITFILDRECICFYHNGHSAHLPFDWYVLGYCITHSSCDWKLELNHCGLELVETFLKALDLQPDQCLLPYRGQLIKHMVFRNSYSDIQLEKGRNEAAPHLLVTSIPQMLVFGNLTHLSLPSNELTSKICNHLCEHTDFLQHLLSLDLNNNPIGRGGAVNLIKSLIKFSTIRELSLNGTGVGFEDCKALSELLASSKYIKVLDIGWNAFTSDSIQLIVDGLSCNTSLEILCMYPSNLSSGNVLSLGSVLKVNARLRVLNIPVCNIQSIDSVYLAKALEENTATQLRALYLSDNPIGSAGAVAFAAMLATNKSLAELHMSRCSIGGEGAVCLAKALEKNSTVKEFHIDENPIGSAGAVAFGDKLATNESLATLYMDGCSIEGEGAFAISRLLKRNQCLKMLDIRDDSVGVEGALNLLESLKQNTTLVKVVLSNKCKPPSFSTVDTALQQRVVFR